MRILLDDAVGCLYLGVRDTGVDPSGLVALRKIEAYSSEVWTGLILQLANDGCGIGQAGTFYCYRRVDT